MEEQGFDAAPTAGAVLELLRDAWAVLPGTFDLAVAELSVGLRPAVRDHLPAVGATATPGLFVATGHHRHGILLAPATAHYLAELVGRGVMPPALVPLDPARLAGDPAPAGRARSA
jgi:glycine oxidase